MASRLEGWNGSDIRSLCVTASERSYDETVQFYGGIQNVPDRDSFRPISYQDFLGALEEVPPTPRRRRLSHADIYLSVLASVHIDTCVAFFRDVYLFTEVCLRICMRRRRDVFPLSSAPHTDRLVFPHLSCLDIRVSPEKFLSKCTRVITSAPLTYVLDTYKLLLLYGNKERKCHSVYYAIIMIYPFRVWEAAAVCREESPSPRRLFPGRERISHVFSPLCPSSRVSTNVYYLSIYVCLHAYAPSASESICAGTTEGTSL